MDNSIYALTSGANAEFHRMHVTSNNVANSNTEGYKKDSPLFAQYLYKDVKDGAASLPQDKATVIDFSQGSLKHTNSPLDFAIQGQGFFMIETGEGVRYTRNGHFLLNSEGELVTTNGDRVLTDGGAAIVFDKGDGEIILSGKGMLFAKTAEGRMQERGRIGIATFEDLSSLRKTKDTLLSSIEEANISTDIRLTQNMLEESNSDSMREMQNLIEIQRKFEGNNSLIKNTYESYANAYSAFAKQ